MQGDATDESMTIEGGPFNVVIAPWLLNYAPDQQTMAKMFKNIGRHLEKGGWFVGLTIPPLLTDSPAEKDILNSGLAAWGAQGQYGNAGEVIATMPNGDGYKVLTKLGLREEGHEIAKFECYYLRVAIFQQACKDSGMFEGLEWKAFVVPEGAKKGKPVGYWNELQLAPNCRVCVARKV